MAQQDKKETKVITRRRKFIEVEVPLTRTTLEVLGNTPQEVIGRMITLDLTRQLKGKSVTVLFKIELEGNTLVAFPKRLSLMPYFIRRMIRKKISYIEDSFLIPSQNSLIKIKPFLITRNKVSRAVRKALRNRCKNWIEDYVSQRTDKELFQDILNNKIQKPLSLALKKTYPLSLCEIRSFDLRRKLNPEEVPKLNEKQIESEMLKSKKIIHEGIDQMAEIEEEQLKAELEIKQTQEKASRIQEEEIIEQEKEIIQEKEKDKKAHKEKKSTKKKIKKEE